MNLSKQQIRAIKVCKKEFLKNIIRHYLRLDYSMYDAICYTLGHHPKIDLNHKERDQLLDYLFSFTNLPEKGRRHQCYMWFDPETVEGQIARYKVCKKALKSIK